MRESIGKALRAVGEYLSGKAAEAPEALREAAETVALEGVEWAKGVVEGERERLVDAACDRLREALPDGLDELGVGVAKPILDELAAEMVDKAFAAVAEVLDKINPDD